MTCSSCGAVFAQDAHFCPRCGAPVVLQPQPVPLYASYANVLPWNRVFRHLQVAGILWIVYAFERAASKIVGLMFLHGIFSKHWDFGWSQWAPLGDFSFGMIWPVVVVSLIVGLVLSLITGYALLTRQPWGRVVAIVTSILALFHPIFGTALGIYTLWVLAPAASGDEYAAISAATPR